MIWFLVVFSLALSGGLGAPTAVYKFVKCNPEGDQSNCITHQSATMEWSPDLPTKLPASEAQELEAEPVEDERDPEKEGMEEDEEYEYALDDEYMLGEGSSSQEEESSTQEEESSTQEEESSSAEEGESPVTSEEGSGEEGSASQADFAIPILRELGKGQRHFISFRPTKEEMKKNQFLHP